MAEKEMDCQIYRLILGQNCMGDPKNALILYIEQPRLIKNVTESLVSSITKPDTKIKVRACNASTLLSELEWNMFLMKTDVSSITMPKYFLLLRIISYSNIFL
eukprot:123978_1